MLETLLPQAGRATAGVTGGRPAGDNHRAASYGHPVMKTLKPAGDKAGALAALCHLPWQGRGIQPCTQAVCWPLPAPAPGETPAAFNSAPKLQQSWAALAAGAWRAGEWLGQTGAAAHLGEQKQRQRESPHATNPPGCLWPCQLGGCCPSWPLLGAGPLCFWLLSKGSCCRQLAGRCGETLWQDVAAPGSPWGRRKGVLEGVTCPGETCSQGRPCHCLPQLRGKRCAHLREPQGQHKEPWPRTLLLARHTQCPFLRHPTPDPTTRPHQHPPAAAQEALVPTDRGGHCRAEWPGNKAPFSGAAGSRLSEGDGCQCQHCPLPTRHHQLRHPCPWQGQPWGHSGPA